MDKPTQTHLDSAMMVLQHIKSSPKKGLLFSKDSVIDLIAYLDADYMGSFSNKNSITGFYTYLACNFIIWRNKKQPIIAIALRWV